MREPPSYAVRLRSLFALLVLTGCTGEIVNPVSPVGGGRCGVSAPGTKLIRLTHGQYDNTVSALFGATLNPSIAFQKDATFQGFDNNAAGLSVADRLGRDYRRAAEELSAQVVTTPAMKSAVLPCTQSTEACAREFIADFGLRAFRRPLASAQVDTYYSLFQRAPALVEGTHSAFDKGVQLVLEAMLQSSHFLYRVELAESPAEGVVVPLDGYEVAARLSFLLWNTAPDRTMLALAQAGELSSKEQVGAQAAKMLDDPRAAAVVDDFHYQWLDLNHYLNLNRDTTLYPDFDPSLGPVMQQETLRFARDVVLGPTHQPFSALYTAKHTFVNAPLANLYGLSGTFNATDYSRVELDGSKRAGLLTQLGFLASHAYQRTPSPIHRGVFIIRRVLCLPQADPPGNADLTLPPLMGAVKTTRQQVDAHTSPAGCNGCHARINGIGFAFENYDAVGQHRTTDNGESVDATGSLELGDRTFDFSNGVEFVTQLSEAPEARRCYALNWLRYAYQRQDTDADTCALDSMATELAEPSKDIMSMIVSLTQNGSFRYRPAQEAP